MRTLKEKLRKITEQFDHTCLNDCKELKNPTTENLSRFIYEKIKTDLPKETTVEKVRVWKHQKPGANILNQKARNNTLDKIFVKNLVLPCKVGVTEEERSQIQNVILDIEVFCDLSQVGATDDLQKGVDYIKIVEIAKTVASKGEFVVIESLAEKVAALVLSYLAVLV